MDLWQDHQWLGKPIKVGEWEYQGQRLAVRLFTSDTLYGTGDYEDLEYGDDQTVDCYYLELQAAGDQQWGSIRPFLSLEEIARFNDEQLSGTLRWHD